MRPRLHGKLHVEPKGTKGYRVKNSLMLGALCHCRDQVLTVVCCILTQLGARQQQPAVVEPVKVKAELNLVKIGIHLLESEGDFERGEGNRHSVASVTGVQTPEIEPVSNFYIFTGGLLAAQCEVHLVDVVLVKGAEAGGAAVLAVLAALITRPVLGEGRVQEGVIVEHHAILSNLRVAIKRVDGTGARVAPRLLLADMVQELRCVDHIAHEDALAPILNL